MKGFQHYGGIPPLQSVRIASLGRNTDAYDYRQAVGLPPFWTLTCGKRLCGRVQFSTERHIPAE
ncbi:MAG: hypothetical protein LBS52_09170 [Dysgonamonadaceae bacterium]|nr:hypothetical protein [Dysgonamonadaceae bacterium]